MKKLLLLLIIFSLAINNATATNPLQCNNISVYATNYHECRVTVASCSFSNGWTTEPVSCNAHALSTYPDCTTICVSDNTCSYYLTSCNNTFTTEGSHTFKAQAITLDGHQFYMPNQNKSFAFSIDLYPPTTTHDAPTTSTTDLTVNLTCDDGLGRGCDETFYCVDDTGTCTPETLGTQFTLTCPQDKVCEKFMVFYSTDLMGRVETIKVESITIDKTTSIENPPEETPPEEPLLEDPLPEENPPDNTPPEEPLLEDPLPEENPPDNTPPDDIPDDIPNDIANDNTPPVLSNNAPSGWKKTNAIISLFCSDSGSECNISSIKYRIENESYQYASIVSIKNEGTHYVSYSAKDNAGNTATDGFEVWIDKTPPNVPNRLTAIPGNGKISIGWNASTDSVSSVKEYEIYLRSYDQQSMKLSKITNLTTTTIERLQNGKTYYLDVLAVDLAGNKSAFSGAISVTLTESQTQTEEENDLIEDQPEDIELIESTELITPNDFDVYIFEDEIVYIWELIAPDNVLYYEIWKKTNENEFILTENTRKTYFSDKNVEQFVPYELKIRPVGLDGITKGEFSDSVSAMITNSNVTIQKEEVEIFHFKISPDTIEVFEGETITALVLARDKSGDIVEYEWNFGDGSTLKGEKYENIRHNYYLDENQDETIILKIKAKSGDDYSETIEITLTLKNFEVIARMINPKTDSDNSKTKNQTLDFEFLLENDSGKMLTKEEILTAKAFTQTFKIPLNTLENGLLSGQLFVSSLFNSPIDYVKFISLANTGLNDSNIITYFQFFLEPQLIIPETKNNTLYLGEKLSKINFTFKSGKLKSVPNKIKVTLTNFSGSNFTDINLVRNTINSSYIGDERDLLNGLEVEFSGKDIFGNQIDDIPLKIKISKDNPEFDLQILEPDLKENDTFNYSETLKIKLIATNNSYPIIVDSLTVNSSNITKEFKYDLESKSYIGEITLPKKNLNQATFNTKINAQRIIEENNLQDFEEFKVNLTSLGIVEILNTSALEKPAIENQTNLNFSASFLDGTAVSKESLTVQLTVNGETFSKTAKLHAGNVYSIELDKPLEIGENSLSLSVTDEIDASDEKNILIVTPAAIGLLVLAIILIIILYFAIKKYMQYKKKKKAQQEKLEEKHLELLRLTNSLKKEYLRRNITETEYKKRLLETLNKIKKLDKEMNKGTLKPVSFKLKDKKLPEPKENKSINNKKDTKITEKEKSQIEENRKTESKENETIAKEKKEGPNMATIEMDDDLSNWRKKAKEMKNLELGTSESSNNLTKPKKLSETSDKSFGIMSIPELNKKEKKELQKDKESDKKEDSKENKELEKEIKKEEKHEEKDTSKKEEPTENKENQKGNNKEKTHEDKKEEPKVVAPPIIENNKKIEKEKPKEPLEEKHEDKKEDETKHTPYEKTTTQDNHSQSVIERLMKTKTPDKFEFKKMQVEKLEKKENSNIRKGALFTYEELRLPTLEETDTKLKNKEEESFDKQNKNNKKEEKKEILNEENKDLPTENKPATSEERKEKNPDYIEKTTPEEEKQKKKEFLAKFGKSSVADPSFKPKSEIKSTLDNKPDWEEKKRLEDAEDYRGKSDFEQFAELEKEINSKLETKPKKKSFFDKLLGK